MWGAFMLYLGVDERALPSDVRPFLQVTDVPSDGGAPRCTTAATC
jgi:hypothetical protein